MFRNQERRDKSVAIRYFLECHRLKHRIDIPAPTVRDSTRNPLGTSLDEKSAVFVCNQCGCVSSYTNEELHSEVVPEPDPFQLRAYTLCSIEPECDGLDCIAPKRIHEVWHSAKLEGSTNPSRWNNDGSARCSDVHLLAWNPQHGYRYYVCQSPF
jgi:hypothetical protein